MLNLYHTYIFPFLIYCIEVWGNVSHCHRFPLFFTKNEIVRLIIFSKHLAHTEHIFKSLNILPLINSLEYYRIGLFMYKLCNELFPKVEIELYVTRNKYKYSVFLNLFFLYNKSTSIEYWTQLKWLKCKSTVKLTIFFIFFVHFVQYQTNLGSFTSWSVTDG